MWLYCLTGDMMKEFISGAVLVALERGDGGYKKGRET